MADMFTKKKRSEIMSRIRSANTKPELLAFAYLRKQHIYFQKHYKTVRGCPDVAIPRKKIALFIHGKFWHGYKWSSWVHRLPKVYWREKILGNIARDKRNMRFLRKKGWRIMRVWEHQLQDPRILQKMASFLKKK